MGPWHEIVNLGWTARFGAYAELADKYQWKKDGIPIPNTNSFELRIDNVKVEDAGWYSCESSNLAGSCESWAAPLIIENAPLSPPIISIQPPAFAPVVGEGKPFKLGVACGGTAPLYYRWYSKARVEDQDTAAVPLASADGNICILPAVTLGTTATAARKVYYCVIRNAYGRVRSKDAEILIVCKPTISLQPSSQTITLGKPVQFTCRVQSSNRVDRYQWKRDGVTIDGATSNTFTIKTTQYWMAGHYRCELINAAGVTLTEPAMLNIVPPPPFINRQPQSQTIKQGESVSFDCGYMTDYRAPATVRWKKNGVPIPNTSDDRFIIPAATLQDAGEYTCEITNMAGVSESSTATLTVLAPPQVLAGPGDAWREPGTSATLSVAAGGSAPLTYQWLKDGQALAGQTSSTLRLEALTKAQTGQYVCRVSNGAGAACSTTATLTVRVAGRLASAAEVLRYTEGSGLEVNVERGERATSQTLILRNTGEEAIHPRGGAPGTPGLAFAGPHAGEFRVVSGGLPPALAPGQSAPVVVEFRPSATRHSFGLQATLQATATSASGVDSALQVRLQGDAVPVRLSAFEVE